MHSEAGRLHVCEGQEGIIADLFSCLATQDKDLQKVLLKGSRIIDAGAFEADTFGGNPRQVRCYIRLCALT